MREAKAKSGMYTSVCCSLVLSREGKKSAIARDEWHETILSQRWSLSTMDWEGRIQRELFELKVALRKSEKEGESKRDELKEERRSTA